MKLARAEPGSDEVTRTLDDVDQVASSVITEHRLRGMDALHLAAALRYAAASAPEDVAFVSFDRDQRAAAAAEGLEVRPKKL